LSTSLTPAMLALLGFGPGVDPGGLYHRSCAP